MTESTRSKILGQALKIILFSILFLFFIQLLTEFVEAIYLFGLLGSDIPPEIGMVLFFLSPLLLYAFRGRISPRVLQTLATIVILSRAVEIALPTRGRMIVSGIGVAAWLLLAPGLLSQPRSAFDRRRLAQLAGAALALALITSILMRALHSGSDLSAFGIEIGVENGC